MKKNNISLVDILGVVFIILKLIKVINWSWLWVLSPFWIEFAFLVFVAFIKEISERE